MNWIVTIGMLVVGALLIPAITGWLRGERLLRPITEILEASPESRALLDELIPVFLCEARKESEGQQVYLLLAISGAADTIALRTERKNSRAYHRRFTQCQSLLESFVWSTVEPHLLARPGTRDGQLRLLNDQPVLWVVARVEESVHATTL